MKDHSVNFYDVQKTFNEQNKKALRERAKDRLRVASGKKKRPNPMGEEESEIPGYTQYKRWEWFMQPRVSSTGERFNPSQTWTEMQAYKNHYPSVNTAGNWTFMGPGNSSALSGAGRLNFVRIDPNNSDNIFTGSPSGGLWQSTDAGATWITNTDNFAQVIGCTDIAIDPSNSNTMYLATGDGDAGDTYSIGVLKSTDGGVTWNPTGLSFFPGNVRQMSKILLDPSNSNVLIVATSGGIYRSDDAAATFTLVQSGGFKDMEFKPGNSSTVYACGTEFYKSTDNGQTWAKITTGLPVATNVSRMAIAVTPANADVVCMIVGLPAPNYGTEGYYTSSNSGTSFTKNGAPNIGTQQWYDLAIAVSPTNSQEIVIGGQTQFLRSTNGGNSWSNNGGNMHVDHHDIIFTDATTYYVANDGGLYRTTNNGSSYSELSNNIPIAQMYGFGQSASDPNLHIQGWQDNGTNLFDGTWQQTMGGDGMLCFISKTNDNNMWGSQYEGSLNRSTNGGNSWNGATTGITEVGAWVTPWIEDPITSNTLWAGFVNMWQSTNGGVSWTKKSTFANANTLNSIAVSPANNQVVWAAKSGGFYLSTNGGTSWTTLTTAPNGNITGIACSNTDANKAWITFSGFSNTTKVFQTNDQGATWINLSQSLPNIPVNCVTYVNNSNDAVYVGTDVGVFYKDASLNVWQNFSNGMPNVIVTQINIFYPTGNLRASTYGRGMWESGPYIPGAYAPSSYFAANTKISCPGAAVQFTDLSSGQPTSWSWTFTGGSPSSSTSQNPLVFYNTPGTYSVTLTATNAVGTSTVTNTNYIVISSSPVSNPTTVGAQRCGPGVVNLSATGSGTGTLRWWDAPGGGNLLTTGNNYSPNISGTTTYYVDEDLPPGFIDFAGAADNSMGVGAYFTANDIRGIYFDVFAPTILNTVDVYSSAAADRTIEILDAQGNTYIDTTVFIAASPNQNTPVTVTLNLTLLPGSNYFMKCRGLVNLYRNSSGAVYPYTGATASVTGSNAGSPGYYYFFYNWILTEIYCNTGRTSCTASDTCSTVGISDFTTSNHLDIYPNPAEGFVTVRFLSEKVDDFQLRITNMIGEEVMEQKFDAVKGEFNRQLDISTLSKGVYFITIANSKNEITRKLVVN
jgi:PKD repeat protein